MYESFHYSYHYFMNFMICASNKVAMVGGVTAVTAGLAEKVGVIAVVAPSHGDIASFCAIGGLILGVFGYFTSLAFQVLRFLRESAEMKRQRMGKK